MRALASTRVDVGALVLVTLVMLGFIAWLIERRQTGSPRGMHAAPAARSAREVRVIAGRPRLSPAPAQKHAKPAAVPPFEPLPAPVAAAVAEWESRPVTAPLMPLPVVPPATMQIVPVPAMAAVPVIEDFTAELPPVAAVMDRAARLAQLRGQELLDGWATDVAAASQSPDWDDRPVLPGYLLEQVGHDGDTAAAVDSMFTRAQAAAVAAALAGDGIAGAIRDGAL